MSFWNRKAKPSSTTIRLSPPSQQQQREDLTKEVFLSAAFYGNLEEVKECIQNGVDKEAKGNSGWTALHIASRYGFLEIVKYLVESCHVDKEAKTKFGFTALHCACHKGELEIVQYLIEKCHVEKEAKDNDGQTAYDVAVTNNRRDVVEYLTKAKIRADVATTNHNQNDLISTKEIFLNAVKKGNLEKGSKNITFDIAACNSRTCVAEYLNEAQFKTKAINEEENDLISENRGEVPGQNKDTEDTFLEAARAGSLDKVIECIENGVNKDARDQYGYTALHFASDIGQLEMVKYLAETAHADAERKDKDGWNALHCASYVGNLEVVKYFIEEGHVDTEAKDNTGRTAYDLAMQNNNTSVAAFLNESQANTAAKNNNQRDTIPQSGELPGQPLAENLPTILSKEVLLEAAEKGNLKKVMECIQNDINKNAKDKNGLNALHYASWKGHLEIVKYLVETCHVNKEARSNDGSTALHCASVKGRLEIVKYLVESCNVDKDGKTNSSRSALHLASYYGQLEIVEYLINEGCVNIEAKTNEGSTAYDLAMQNNNTSVAEYLKIAQFKLAAINDNRNNEIPENGEGPGQNNDTAALQSSADKPSIMPTEDELLEAGREGNLDKVIECIEKGVNKEAKSDNGGTTLHAACCYGHLEVVKYLVETCQVNKEAKNNDGSTALHFASFNGRLENLQYLIESCQVDEGGKTTMEDCVALRLLQKPCRDCQLFN